MSILTPAEILIAARRLAGARPYLAAVAGMCSVTLYLIAITTGFVVVAILALSHR